MELGGSVESVGNQLLAVAQWTPVELDVGGVYRLFAADGCCLYAGQSKRHPAARAQQHRRELWWPEVARADFTLLRNGDDYAPGDATQLNALERAAIRKYKPLYNILETGRRPRIK